MAFASAEVEKEIAELAAMSGKTGDDSSAAAEFAARRTALIDAALAMQPWESGAGVVRAMGRAGLVTKEEAKELCAKLIGLIPK